MFSILVPFFHFSVFIDFKKPIIPIIILYYIKYATYDKMKMKKDDAENKVCEIFDVKPEKNQDLCEGKRYSGKIKFCRNVAKPPKKKLQLRAYKHFSYKHFLEFSSKNIYFEED